MLTFASQHVDGGTWAIAIIFTILWIALWWKPMKWALRRQKEKNQAAAQQTEREKAVGLQRFEGRISVQSQYANPGSGQGRLILTERGISWEIDGFRGRTDSTPWPRVMTFARSGSLVHIEWTANMGSWESSGPDLAAAVQFSGAQTHRIEEMARKYLTGGTWQTNVDLGAEGKWDALYSTRD